MAHLHSIYDSDAHFSINPTTRLIRNESEKNHIMQYDHDSERFTFEIPRFVEGHDMSICDKIEIHYINIAANKADQSKDVYIANDVQISPEDENVVIFSWLISGNATRYAGSLNFIVRFTCLDGENISYAWNTAIFDEITVSDGMNNAETVIVEYSDLLETWKRGILAEVDVDLTANKNAAIAEIEAKGAATLASIPEDYSALDAKVDLHEERLTDLDCRFYPVFELGNFSLTDGVIGLSTGSTSIRTCGTAPHFAPKGTEISLDEYGDFSITIFKSTDNGATYINTTIKSTANGVNGVYIVEADALVHIRIQVTSGLMRGREEEAASHLVIKVPSLRDEVAKIKVIADKAYGRMPIVTFIDDDGVEESLDNWAVLADETGVHPTVAVCTSRVGQGDYAGWDKIKMLNNRGFEIVSHCHTHTNLTTLTEAEIEAEFQATISAFWENGLKAEFLAYPFNSTNGSIIRIVRRYFKAAVAGGNENNVPPLRPHYLTRQSVCLSEKETKTDSDGTTREVGIYRTLDDLKSCVDEAVANTGWVIFMTHLRDKDVYQYDDNIKQMLKDLIKYSVDSGCRIVTLGEGYAEYKNRLDIGNTWDTNRYIVGCDGSINKSGTV